MRRIGDKEWLWKGRNRDKSELRMVSLVTQANKYLMQALIVDSTNKQGRKKEKKKGRIKVKSFKVVVVVLPVWLTT